MQHVTQVCKNDLGKKIESDCPQAKDRKGGYISFHDLLNWG